VELGAIPAPFGRYAVLGNHDWWGDASRITRRLEEAGIQVLTIDGTAGSDFGPYTITYTRP